MRPERAPVSVLVPTLNERQNITDCLECLRFSDDVVVVDSASSDGTRELAIAAGARVVDFRWDGRHPKKKNWALENVSFKHPWVLIVDADERIPPELAVEIAEAVARTGSAGYFVNRRFMFMGRWIRHCGYYPSWNLRLFLRARGRYERILDEDVGSGDNEVHEHVVLDGPTGRLKQDMLHYAYPDVATWVEKHNRYSSWEAAVEVEGGTPQGGAIGEPLVLRRRLRKMTRHFPFRPTLRFLYGYILRLGFLDGYPGYALCRLMAIYELLNVMKARERRMSSLISG